MIKLICLIKRPDHESAESFRKWWLGHHSNVAAKLPGLRRYLINTTSVDENACNFDGIAELWFDSRSAMEDAFRSPQGAACREEDERFIGERVAFVTEEHLISIPGSRAD